MSLKGNQIYEKVLFARCLDSQSIGQTTVNGTAITAPWRKGRQISFIVNGGAFASGADGAIVIQVQKKSDSSWVNMTDKDGNTLQFPVALLDDAGGAESAIRIGTVDLSRVDGDTYKAMRVAFTNAGAGAMLIGIAAMISDLYAHPSAQTDDLYALTIPNAPA